MHALDAFILLGSGAGVVYLALHLTRAADALAERTGMGRAWVGTVLLAAATSLPELATDVAAVALDAPDLAAGDLFGSSLTNLFLLGIVDVSHPGAGFLRRRGRERLGALFLALSLTAVAGILVWTQPAFTIGPVGPGSLLLVGLYLGGLHLLAALGRTVRQGELETVMAARAGGARAPAVAFALAALGLVVVASVFAASAQRFAAASGLGETFVGSWLVAFATSLPELVSCLTAVRLGAPDLAVGNILGSNAFNMVLFAPLDLLRPGSFFTGLDRAHAATAGGAMLLMLVAGMALLRGTRSSLRRDPAGYLLVVLYVGCLLALRELTSG